jgi:ribosomal protein L28
MNRTILTFFFPETNPRNKSFEHSRTKRIHETNLLNTIGICESGPQDLGSIKVHLCSKVSWWFVGFVKKGWILSKRVYELNPQNGSFEHPRTKRIHKMNLWTLFVLQIHIHNVQIRISSKTNPNWLATNPDLRNESTFLRISCTIPASLLIINQCTFLK